MCCRDRVNGNSFCMRNLFNDTKIWNVLRFSGIIFIESGVKVMPLPKAEMNFERTSAKQRVYETVKDWIIERQLRPGEKVSDIEMASYFHVSRTPVREALQLLETQKLVKSYPGKATLVTELQTDDIEKWYLPMATLQQLAISLAVDRITLSHINQLYKLSNQFKECIKEQNKPMPIMKADEAFHRYILEIAGNEYISDFCDVLWIHIQRLEYSYFRDTPLEASVEEHERIIGALEMRDSYSASLFMKNHWDRTVLMIHSLNQDIVRNEKTNSLNKSGEHPEL